MSLSPVVRIAEPGQAQVYFSLVGGAKLQLDGVQNWMHSRSCRNEGVSDETCIQQKQLQLNGYEKKRRSDQVRELYV
jgi:hypothetical protein